MTEAQAQADVAEATAKPLVEPEAAVETQPEAAKPKSVSTVERILEGGFELRKVQVDVKEWEALGAGPVFLREMTALERDKFERENDKLQREDEDHSYRVEFLFRTLCKENGKPLFLDSQREALNDLPSRVVQKLFTVATRLNALTEGDLEELAKNLEQVERGASS